MIRSAMMFAMATALVVGAGYHGVRADDKKAPVEKSNPKADNVTKLATAYDLIKLGREMKSPEALIVAARIIGETPVDEKGGHEDKSRPQESQGAGVGQPRGHHGREPVH